jgi:structural maintenance of chromosome 3 (chondroitin sulfate proteoglycan 6)
VDINIIQQQNQRLEKYLSKKSILLKKKDECARNIRDLGVLPEEAFGTHDNEDSKSLLSKLHTVNDGLKQFSHINKKAFEQYSSFTKQREGLNKRKADLDTSAQVYLLILIILTTVNH